MRAQFNMLIFRLLLEIRVLERWPCGWGLARSETYGLEMIQPFVNCVRLGISEHKTLHVLVYSLGTPNIDTPEDFITSTFLGSL